MGRQTRPLKSPSPFIQTVLDIVSAIPRGRVLTYGQVALIAGVPRGARQVGRVLYSYGGTVPWQRVVNHYGGLSTYKVGTGELQRALLRAEGVRFRKDGTLDLEKYGWHPRTKTLERLALPGKVAAEVNAKLPFTP